MMIHTMKEYKHIYICHMYTTTVCTYTYAYGLSYDFYQTKQLTNKIGSWASRERPHDIKWVARPEEEYATSHMQRF